jgi:hypothetical protein
MSIYTPIRLDRMQRAMMLALEDACGVGVHWALTEPSHEQLGAEFIALRLVGGPSPFNRTGKRGTLLNPATSIVVTVDAATVGKRATIELNDFMYGTDIVALDTVTTVRDRLSALIAADTLEPVTPSDVGADGIMLTADFLGAMRNLNVFGPLSTGSLVVNPNSVLVTEGEQSMLCNVQSYSKGQEPRNGAWALSQLAYAAMQSEDYIEQLHAAGVAVWERGISTDLSAVIGGRWESRVSFDLTLAMQSAWVRPIARIETVNLETDISGIQTTDSITP